MNEFEYNTEIRSIAADLVQEAMGQAKEACSGMDYNEQDFKNEAEELINDSLLHETIDGHQWAIYYSYNMDVIKHSDNETYMQDNIGGFSDFDDLNTLHTHVAFWCMYADVQEQLESAFDSYEEEQEEVE